MLSLQTVLLKLRQNGQSLFEQIIEMLQYYLHISSDCLSYRCWSLFEVVCIKLKKQDMLRPDSKIVLG